MFLCKNLRSLSNTGKRRPYLFSTVPGVYITIITLCYAANDEVVLGRGRSLKP